MNATTSAEGCSREGEQDMFQTKWDRALSTEHQALVTKVVTKKGKRSSIPKMANNLVGQLKEMDLSTHHMKEAHRKVNRISKLA